MKTAFCGTAFVLLALAHVGQSYVSDASVKSLFRRQTENSKDSLQKQVEKIKSDFVRTMDRYFDRKQRSVVEEILKTSQQDCVLMAIYRNLHESVVNGPQTLEAYPPFKCNREPFDQMNSTIFQIATQIANKAFNVLELNSNNNNTSQDREVVKTKMANDIRETIRMKGNKAVEDIHSVVKKTMLEILSGLNNGLQNISRGYVNTLLHCFDEGWNGTTCDKFNDHVPIEHAQSGISNACYVKDLILRGTEIESKTLVKRTSFMIQVNSMNAAGFAFNGWFDTIAV